MGHDFVRNPVGLTLVYGAQEENTYPKSWSNPSGAVLLQLQPDLWVAERPFVWNTIDVSWLRSGWFKKNRVTRIYIYIYIYIYTHTYIYIHIEGHLFADLLQVYRWSFLKLHLDSGEKNVGDFSTCRGGWKNGGDSPERWLLVGPLAGELGRAVEVPQKIPGDPRGLIVTMASRLDTLW